VNYIDLHGKNCIVMHRMGNVKYSTNLSQQDAATLKDSSVLDFRFSRP